MRSLLIISFFVLFAILSVPLLLIAAIFHKINPKLSTSLALWVTRNWARVLLFLAGTRVTVIGLDNIPDIPCLFVGNHGSLFDIPVVYSKLPRLVGFVSKKEIQKIPIMSHWMNYLGCLFLDRTNIREGLKTILVGIDRIKSGHSLVIFPEGTRSGSDTILPFKEGSLKLAEKSGCPVIPMAITNSEKILFKHSLSVKRAHVKLHFGEPIYLNQLDKEEQKFSGQYVRNVIQEMLNKDRLS